MSERISQLIRVLDQLPEEQAEVLLKRMFVENPLAALRVIQRHFDFEDLVFADDAGIDALIETLGIDPLVVALSGAPDPLVRRFSDRMGTGLARTFIDDVHQAVPSRDSVQKMRQLALMKALFLHKKGKLRVNRPGVDNLPKA